MDIIQDIGELVEFIVRGLSLRSFGVVVRLGLLLLFPWAVCCFAFSQGNRSVFVQWVCAFTAALFVLCLPLDPLMALSGVKKIWLLGVSAGCIGFIPFHLAYFLCPYPREQGIIARLIYVIIAFVFLLHLITMPLIIMAHLISQI